MNIPRRVKTLELKTQPRPNLVLGLILIIGVLSCAPSKPANTGLSYDPVGATTETKAIRHQPRRIIGTGSPTIWLDNRFAGARAVDFVAVNDTVFRVVIAPENAPINRSPYYAFRIWSDEPRTAWIELSYEGASHRYQPKMSRDRVTWTPIAATDRFVIDLTTESVWISAQPLLTTYETIDWLSTLKLPKETIRYSHLGRPIWMTRINETGKSNAPAIVLMTRQHPPEITGELAFRTFVETLMSDHPTMKAFRGTHQFILFPMMNPDGVDGGHWRHNAGGVDLNRDWGTFNQPETRAVREAMLSIAAAGTPVVFLLDFHSTSYDVFYTISRDVETSGKSDRWLKGISDRVPGYVIRDEPSGVAPAISKNWFFKELKAVGVTYEVGDRTPEDLFRKVAEAAAHSLADVHVPK